MTPPKNVHIYKDTRPVIEHRHEFFVCADHVEGKCVSLSVNEAFGIKKKSSHAVALHFPPTIVEASYYLSLDGVRVYWLKHLAHEVDELMKLGCAKRLKKGYIVLTTRGKVLLNAFRKLKAMPAD